MADTNVLVCLLMADDDVQASKARRVFGEVAGRDVSVWISDTVLVEVVWTLGRTYGRGRRDIVRALRALASDATVVSESPAAVRSATDAFEQGPADFACCLLDMKAAALGCDQVVTFDQGMKALPGVRVL